MIKRMKTSDIILQCCCCRSQLPIQIFLFQKSIKEALNTPEFVMTDFAKFDRPGQLHIAFQALHEYIKRKSVLPRSRNKVKSVWSKQVYFDQMISVWCPCMFSPKVAIRSFCVHTNRSYTWTHNLTVFICSPQRYSLFLYYICICETYVN